MALRWTEEDLKDYACTVQVPVLVNAQMIYGAESVEGADVDTGLEAEASLDGLDAFTVEETPVGEEVFTIEILDDEEASNDETPVDEPRELKENADDVTPVAFQN